MFLYRCLFFLCSVFSMLLFLRGGDSSPPDSPLAYRQRGILVGMNPSKNLMFVKVPKPLVGRQNRNCRPPCCRQVHLPDELPPMLSLASFLHISPQFPFRNGGPSGRYHRLTIIIGAFRPAGAWPIFRALAFHSHWVSMALSTLIKQCLLKTTLSHVYSEILKLFLQCLHALLRKEGSSRTFDTATLFTTCTRNISDHFDCAPLVGYQASVVFDS